MDFLITFNTKFNCALCTFHNALALVTLLAQQKVLSGFSINRKKLLNESQTKWAMNGIFLLQLRYVKLLCFLFLIH